MTPRTYRSRDGLLVRRPGVCFGRWCTAEGWAPIVALRERHRAGDTVEDLAADYGISAESVRAALAWRGGDRDVNLGGQNGR